jgi:nucleosome assembly protein 1-like 1
MPSFFDFFDPVEKLYSDEMGEEEEADMERDFEIALTFRDSIIPKAVLYLTDEIAQFDGLDSIEDDEDDSSGDDEGSDGGDENMEV